MATEYSVLSQAAGGLLDGCSWAVVESPENEGVPWRREGHASVVYQLKDSDRSLALKVLRPGYSRSVIETNAERLRSWADCHGLRVAQRAILDQKECRRLLGFQPEGDYGIIMPWIEGPLWRDVVTGRWELMPEQCLRIARGLATVLHELEANGLTHCQVAGRHLVLPFLARRSGTMEAAALVDLERAIGPGITPSNRQEKPQDDDSDQLVIGDRFAGSILIAEILAWCDGMVRDGAAEGSFFAPEELRRDGTRVRLLFSRLEERWGAIPAGLFQKAWASPTSDGCAAPAEWLAAIPDAYVQRTIKPPAPQSVGYETPGPIVATPWSPPQNDQAAHEPATAFPVPQGRQWWRLPAAMFALAVIAAAAMISWPASGSPSSSPPGLGSALPASIPPPPTMDFSQIESSSLADNGRWLAARAAFDASNWSEAFQELNALRQEGHDLPEVRALLAVVFVNNGDALVRSGDEGAGLTQYLLANDLDPELPGLQERIVQMRAATTTVTVTVTATATRTPTATVTTPSTPRMEGVVPSPPPGTTNTPTASPRPTSPTSTPGVLPTATPSPRPSVIIVTPPPAPPTATFTATEVPAPTATSPPAVPLPAAPTGVRAQSQSCRSILVTWEYDPTFAGGFRIYRWGQFAGGVTRSRFFTDTGLEPDTVYQYTVSATGPGGESQQSAAGEARTQPASERCR